MLILAEEGGFEPPEQIYFARRFSKPLRESDVSTNMAGILRLFSAYEVKMRVNDDPPVTHEMTQPRRQAGAHLYVILSDSGMVKIGRSSSPRKRKAALQMSTGHTLKLVKVLRGRGGEEASIHAAVKKWRRNGEWFHDTMDFRARLQEVLGVKINFFREYQEEEEARAARLEAETEAIFARAIQKMNEEADRRAIRRAEIAEENASKERRRIERRAIALDIATYDVPGSAP